MGKRGISADVGASGLVGIAKVGDRLLVAPGAIYEGRFGEHGLERNLHPFIENVAIPGDIALDSKRSRLLVPRLADNTIEGYDVTP